MLGRCDTHATRRGFGMVDDIDILDLQRAQFEADNDLTPSPRFRVQIECVECGRRVWKHVSSLSTPRRGFCGVKCIDRRYQCDSTT